jgi:hypothetical protein
MKSLSVGAEERQSGKAGKWLRWLPAAGQVAGSWLVANPRRLNAEC